MIVALLTTRAIISVFDVEVEHFFVVCINEKSSVFWEIYLEIKSNSWDDEKLE